MKPAAIAAALLGAGAIGLGLFLNRRGSQLGAPWHLPDPDSREQAQCFRSVSREARPRTYKAKAIAVRALLDANPKLRNLVDSDCGGDCRAFMAWVNHGRRGPKPRARPGDGRFDALNEQFERRTPGRKIASWQEALYAVAPTTRHWEDFRERITPLEDAAGMRLNLPERAEAVVRARGYVDRCLDVRPEHVPF